MLQGDHITYLNIFNKFMGIKNEGQRIAFCKSLRINHKALSQANRIRLMLITTFQESGISLKENDDYDDPVAIVKSILSGFFTNVAVRVSAKEYRCLSQSGDDKLMEISPLSVLNNICPKYLVFTSVH